MRKMILAIIKFLIHYHDALAVIIGLVSLIGTAGALEAGNISMLRALIQSGIILIVIYFTLKWSYLIRALLIIAYRKISMRM